jgi:hypothetical protein
MPAMAKKRKNKLNKFNHNTENAQKNLKKEIKLDSLNRIKKDIAAINANADKKSHLVRETLDIFQTFTQKIALFALKQKAWIKTQTKTIDAALKSQLIPQLKTVARVIDAKINNLKKIKHNFKQNEITSTLDSIAELNKDRFEISLIQPVSHSSPKVIGNLKILTNAKTISDIKYNARPCSLLPKLMSLNVQPTARLEKTLYYLLQKLFEENTRKTIIKDDMYEKHQFETKNESFESFKSNSYSMADIQEIYDYALKETTKSIKERQTSNAKSLLTMRIMLGQANITIAASRVYNKETLNEYQDMKITLAENMSDSEDENEIEKEMLSSRSFNNLSYPTLSTPSLINNNLTNLNTNLIHAKNRPKDYT